MITFEWLLVGLVGFFLSAIAVWVIWSAINILRHK